MKSPAMIPVQIARKIGVRVGGVDRKKRLNDLKKISFSKPELSHLLSFACFFLRNEKIGKCSLQGASQELPGEDGQHHETPGKK